MYKKRVAWILPLRILLCQKYIFWLESKLLIYKIFIALLKK